MIFITKYCVISLYTMILYGREYIHLHLFILCKQWYIVHVLVTIYSITTLALRISKIIMLSNIVIHECTLAHEWIAIFVWLRLYFTEWVLVFILLGNKYNIEYDSKSTIWMILTWALVEFLSGFFVAFTRDLGDFYLSFGKIFIWIFGIFYPRFGWFLPEFWKDFYLGFW